MVNKKIFFLSLLIPSIFFFSLPFLVSGQTLPVSDGFRDTSPRSLDDFSNQPIPTIQPVLQLQDSSVNTNGLSFSSSASQSSSCKGSPNNFGELFDYLICLLQGGVTAFLVGLGLVFFLVGVVNYVSSGDNEEKREGGRNLMIFGIIVLFVMVSVWGFVNILSQSFFGHGSVLPVLPKSGSN